MAGRPVRLPAGRPGAWPATRPGTPLPARAPAARPVPAQPAPARRRGLRPRTVLLALLGMLALGLSTPAAEMPALARASAVEPAAPSTAAPAEGRAPLIPGVDRLHRPGRPERLVVESVSIDTAVVPVEPVLSRGRLVWQTADSAAGHHAGSALPGEAGTVVLSGHLNTPLSGGGAVFRSLPNVRVGDLIQVYTSDRVYRYEVREMKLVNPDQVDAIPSGPEALVTLITCFPDWTFGKRLLVTGVLVDSAALPG